MIVQSMSLDEIASEFQIDYKEVSARWKAYEKKFRKLKANARFPWSWQQELTTKRRNQWLITYYSCSKKEAEISFPQMVMFLNRDNTKWAIYKPTGLAGAFILPTHFISRYRERCIEEHINSSVDISIDPKIVMQIFCIRNPHLNCYTQKCEDSVRGFCEDGMILGEWISENMMLAKTFLSRKEFKPNQFTEYCNFIKSCIIQDICLSRTGSNEMNDSIPDSYFEAQELNNFLFNRGNPNWIKICKECQIFEEKEEYLKCNQMLDAINERRIQTTKYP